MEFLLPLSVEQLLHTGFHMRKMRKRRLPTLRGYKWKRKRICGGKQCKFNRSKIEVSPSVFFSAPKNRFLAVAKFSSSFSPFSFSYIMMIMITSLPTFCWLQFGEEILKIEWKLTTLSQKITFSVTNIEIDFNLLFILRSK